MGEQPSWEPERSKKTREGGVEGGLRDVDMGRDEQMDGPNEIMNKKK